MQRCQPRAVVALLGVALVCAGCVGSRLPHSASRTTLDSRDSVALLRNEISRLGKGVSRTEAERLSNRAHATAQTLARDYHVVGPALFHNFLVNTGVRERGLCYQWTEDLMREVSALHLASVELHWGTARRDTLREHNCVVVTARGQPFRDGIVLDAWRHSGQLFWSPVTADHYPWQEEHDPVYIERATGRRASHVAGQSGRES